MLKTNQQYSFSHRTRRIPSFRPRATFILLLDNLLHGKQTFPEETADKLAGQDAIVGGGFRHAPVTFDIIDS